MRIAECMTSKPSCIQPRDKLAAAKALMEAEGFRRLPVTENGQLIGILSERDIRSHLGYLESTLVDAAMTPNPATIEASAAIEDVVRLMVKRKIGGVPVVEGGKLVGIVTTTDILKVFLDMLRNSARQESGTRPGVVAKP